MFLIADPTLTLHNVSTALDVVRDWIDLYSCLRISDERHDKLEGQHSSPDQRREAGISWWLSVSPDASWQYLAGKLYNWEEKKSALEAVMEFVHIQTGMCL